MNTPRSLTFRRFATRRSPRAVWRLLRLTPLGAGVAAVVGVPPITAWAQANVIKPDGRTATQQTVAGTRTDITTGTIKGDNAFNSFSRFEVAQGQTVNVHVPKQAQRVINIVTDAPVRVEGVLNGLKDGTLGGNLVFADPAGMVVSRSGVINAQSLQVVATTRAHLDAMLDGQGKVGEAAVQQLLDGQAPRSADGRVQIDGKVNVLDKVRIEARRVDIEGRIKAGADALHDTSFRAAVSSQGISVATGMVERGGVIELIADEAVTLKGQLDASQRGTLTMPDAAGAGLGGVVTVQAERIELAAGSRIDVSGLLGGGVATLGSITRPSAAEPAADEAPAPVAPKTQTLMAAITASVEADALERGDGGRIQFLSDGSADFGGFAGARGGAILGRGGFVEVSGRRRVQVYGLVDTTAAKGELGTLLIDPDSLSISTGAAGASSCLNVSDGACAITTGTIAGLAGGANLILQAKDSISFDAGTVLDLRTVMTAHNQTISFLSQDITFAQNAQLITGGGNVKLYALGGQSDGVLGSGKFSYDSKIGWGPLNIGEQVKGGTIELQSGAAIITRPVADKADAASAALTGDAGDVTLRAANIQLNSGSSILAHAVPGGSGTGGSVELTAYSLEQYHLGKATADARVTLAGTVKANAITVNAVARAEASPDGATGFAVKLLQSAVGGWTGLSAGYHETQADAHVDVQGSAVLESTTTLDIAAASVNKAAGSVRVFTVDEKGNNLASAAALYVKTAGVADMQVQSGAQLISGGKATLGAYNDATAKGQVKVLSNNSLGGVVVGIVEADVSATANVAYGAKLNVQSLDLAALQTGNMRSVASTTVAQQKAKDGEPPPPQASVGTAVAVSEIKAQSAATLGASLSNVGDVNVVADTSLWQNYTASRNDVGGDPTIADKMLMGVAGKISPFASNQGKLFAWLGDKFDQLGNLSKGAPPIKAGAVITVNETNLGSKAQIGSGAVINSSGNVAVISATEDRSMHNIAESKVNTQDQVNNGPIINAAVAVGLYTHTAEATVGQNAQITAQHFGSYADIYQPLDVTWLAGFSVDGLRDPLALFKHFAPPNFGMPQFVFTSWATALAEQKQADDASKENTNAITGSVNWTAFNNSAKSWVGSGAKITVLGGDQDWTVNWKSPTVPLLDGDVSMNGEPANAITNILLETVDEIKSLGEPVTNAIGEITSFFNNKPVVLGITLRDSLTFTKALDVKARNQSAFLTFTGQPVDFGVKSVNLGAHGGKLAVGGAFNYASAEHSTIAGIDDGVVARALSGTVGVDALSQDRIIAVAPTAGKGEGSAVDIIAAYSQLDNKTVAVLSSKADVKAQRLGVTATEDVSVWSAAGAAAYGESSASVGIALAVNDLSGRTVAAIADPGALAVGPVRPDNFGSMNAVGSVDVPQVEVLGLTQGTSGAIAASASAVSTKDHSQDDQAKSDEPKSGVSKLMEKVKTKTSGMRQGLVDKLATDKPGKIADARNWLGDKVKEKQQATAAPKPMEASKIAFAAAGSSTVNLGDLDTSSLIDHASLAYLGTKTPGLGDTTSVNARAVNDTHQYSVSGSLAVLRLKAPQTQTGYGVSGAIALDLEDNDTLARVSDSAVKDYGRVGVESLSSGQRISVGLGIAGSGGNKPSYMLSASYSMTDSDNSTVAAVDGGKISSSNDNFRSALEVLSYDKTETGVGAGALTVQANKGGAAGASVGVALIHNQVESRVAGADSDKLSQLDVRAYDPVVLGIGAASVGVNTDQKSTTIEGAVTYGEVENTTRALITDRNGTNSTVKAKDGVVVQASDVTPQVFKDRFTTVLAADGTPAPDSDYDYGASLRQQRQESFGGQSIGTTQPGALMIGVAGGVAVGSGNDAGASAALARVASVHEAVVDGSTVDASTVKVDATDATLMVNVGVGVAGTSGKVALVGSVAVTLDESRATARVGDFGKTTQVTTTAAEGLGVTSASADKAFAIAGAIGISTQGSAGGLAGTVGVNSAVSEALVHNATVNAADTRVAGTTSSQHISVAAAGGYGANASINGSFVINFATERTTAQVNDSSVTGSSLSVKAGDDKNTAAQVYTGAGSFGFSKDVAGGAALTSNTVALNREAAVDRSELKLGAASDALLVQADSSVKMIGVTVAGGGGTGVAFNGAISSNEIANVTKARVSGSTVTQTGGASVLAADRSEMNYGTGAISIGSEAGIGVAIGFNLITNDVSALLQGTDSLGQVRGTGKIALGDARISATSDEKIVNASYGVGGSSTVGGAGSISVNVIDTDVTAHIGRGAQLSADGTVVVDAQGQDDIKAFAGALGLGGNAGVGLSSSVNVIRGATEASVGADGETRTQVDAKGQGNGTSVSTGVLASAIPGITAPNNEDSGALQRFSGISAMTDYDATRAKMRETTETVKGLAVNATSLRHVLSYDTTVGGAAEGVGIGANADAHVISSTTKAEIANAAINQNLAPADTADVRVKSTSHHVLSSFGFSGGVGGGGGAGALGGDVFKTSTTAQVRDSAVKSGRDVIVRASNESAQNGILAGVAGGGSAIAGSVGVVVFDGDVEASILGGTTRAERDVAVDADNAQLLNQITGAGAIGVGGLAAAGSVAVAVSDTTTRALIGRSTDVGQPTVVQTGRDIAVTADSSDSINTFTMTLSGGAGTAVAALASVAVVTNETTASARHADLQVGVASNWWRAGGGANDEGTGTVTTSGPAGGVLKIEANDHGLINQLSGAAGISFGAGGAVGGTVSILVAKSNVTADLRSSLVDAKDVNVHALNSQDQLAGTVGVGGAADVGVGFAISLTMTGTGSVSADQFGNTQNPEDSSKANTASDAFGSDGDAKGTQLMNRIATIANSDRLGETGGMLSASERNAITAQSKRDLSGTLRDAGANSASAAVDASSIKASGNVSVTSNQQTALKNIAGAGGVGLLAGAGGTVGVSLVRNATAAQVTGSQIEADGSVSIGADSGDKSGKHALDLLTVAGGAGLVGFGASVGYGRLDSQVSAQADGQIQASSVSLTANDTTSSKALNVAAAVGGGAAGIAVAHIDRTGTTQAFVNQGGARNGQRIEAGSLSISATTNEGNEVKSVAAAGGLVVAANGAAGSLVDSSQVRAGIGDYSQIAIGGDEFAPGQTVSVSASRGSTASAVAEGVGVSGGVQVGASIAVAKLEGSTTASVGKGVVFDAGSTLTVSASESTGSVTTKSTASGGGVLAGVNAGLAWSQNDASVSASIGDDTLLPEGAVALHAMHRGTQGAETFGVTVGGMLAVGANTSKALTNASSSATLGNVKTSATRLGDLDVAAAGEDTTTAKAVAGGGGLISGQAATALVDDNSKTIATISDAGSDALSHPADYTLRGGALTLDATHNATLRADSDTVNASAVGASGAITLTNANNSATATVGAGVRMQGLGIGLTTANRATEPLDGDNASGAGGGVANGSAVVAKTNFNTESKVELGANAQLTVIGDPSSEQVGRLVMVAATDLLTHTQGSLNTGGVIDIPYAEIESKTKGSNTVKIGDDVQLRSAGDLILGTATLNRTQADTLVKTYGGVGVTGGKSLADSSQTDTITVGSNSLLKAYGDISIATGRDADNAQNLLQAKATTDVYNNTAIPISYENGATANVTQSATITLADTSRVQAGRNVYLRTYQGEQITQANGEGHNPYLDLFSTSTSDSHRSAVFNGKVTVGGEVVAGYYRLRDYAIDGSGNLTQTTDSPELQLPVKTYSMDAAGDYFDANGAKVNPAEVLYPDGFIAKITGFNPSRYYTADAQKKIGKVPDQGFNAYVFPDLVAAGGNIEVDTGIVTGGGNLIARGGPRIRIENASNAFIIANKLVIPDIDSGGAVSFTGAGRLPAGQVQEIDKARTPLISLHNGYDTVFGGKASDIITQAPADGSNPVRNLRGSFRMVNDHGNVLDGGAEALSIEVLAPEGAFVYDQPGKYMAIGGDPNAMWASLDAANRPNTASDFVNRAAWAFYQARPWLGNSSDSVTYSRQLQGIVNNKGSGIDGYLFKGLGNSPGSYSGSGTWYDGRYNFDILPANQSIRFASNAAVSPGGSRQANRIDITARYVDLNAPLRAGTARDIDVTITQNAVFYGSWFDRLLQKNARSFFDCVTDAACRAYNGLTATNGLYKVPAASLVYGVNSPQVSVVYNPLTGHVSTAAIGSSSVGAVNIVGRILNSNSDPNNRAKIELSSGTLKLNINNQSGRPLDLPNIETGAAAGDGVIRVTDLNKLDDAGRPLTTWWVKPDGAASPELHQSHTDAKYTKDNLVVSGTGDGAGLATYSPQAGWRYRWTNMASISRSYSYDPKNMWWDASVGAWTFKNGAAAPEWTLLDASRGPVYDPGNAGTTYISSLRESTRFRYQNVGYSYNGAASRTWAVATNIDLYQDSSVRADFGFDVSFKGYTEGGVTIGSNASTYLLRNINNPGGSTSIKLTSGSLIMGEQGVIRSRDLSLNVAGSIGSSQAPLAVDLDGKLDAIAGGDLAVNAAGSLLVNSAQAGKDGRKASLILKTQGDLLGTAGAELRGFEVDLSSANGRIGRQDGSALVVQTFNIGNSVQQRGVVSAKAKGDIALDLRGGDTRIDAIAAADGDVTIKANGSLYDAREGQGGTGRSDDELQALWEQTLHLSGDRKASVQDYLQHTIAPLDQQVNRDYRAYWDLLALGSLSNGQITLSSKGLGLMRAQAAAGLGLASPSDGEVNAWANRQLKGYTDGFDRLLGKNQWQSLLAFQSRDDSYRFSADRYNEYWTLVNATNAGRQLTPTGRDAIRNIAATVLGGSPSDAQLQAYVDQRFATLGQVFSASLGGGWQGQAAFTSYDPSYHLVADTLLGTFAFGNYWGAERLQNQIRQTAFGQASAGNGGIDHLNVSGRKVSISSSKSSASLGRDNGYLTLPLGVLLLEDARYALSQAVAPGDVQVLTDAQGQITGLKVKDTRAFFVEARDQFDASARGQLFVQGQGALLLGAVASNGSVRLSAQAGITAGGGFQPIKASSLVLDGGLGSLGTALAPLTTQVNELSLARANESIFVTQPVGSLVIDVVNAAKDVHLTLGSGSLTQKQTGLLSLAGENLYLDVAGRVGTDGVSGTGALVLQTRGGELQLKSQDAWLQTSGGTLRLGDSSTGALKLTAPGTLGVTVIGDAKVKGDTQWLVGGETRLESGTTLDVNGKAVITTSSLVMAPDSALKSGASVALTSSAGPTVLADITAKTGLDIDAELGGVQAARAGTVLTVSEAGGAVRFNAHNAGGGGVGGIAGGAADALLRVAADRVSVQSANGAAGLDLLNSRVTLDNSALATGRLVAHAAGDLVLATLAARDGMDLKAAGSLSAQSVTDALQSSGPAALIDLNAGTGIGSAAMPLRVTSDRVSAKTTTGGVYLSLEDAPPKTQTTLLTAQSGQGDVVLRASAGLDITGPVRTVGHVDIVASGALSAADVIEALGADHDLKLQAASLDLAGALKVGRDALLQSHTGDLLVKSRLEAGQDVELRSADRLQAQDVSAARDVLLDAGGPLQGDRVAAGRKLTLARSPEVTVRELVSGAEMSLNFGRADLRSLSVGGALLMQGNSAKVGSATVGANAQVKLSASLDLDALTAGGNVVVSADALKAGALAAGGLVDVQARNASIGSLRSGDDTTLRVTEGLSLSNGSVGRNLSLTAGSASLGGVSVRGDASVSAGSLAVGALSAGGSLAVGAGQVQAGSLQSGGGFALTAGAADVGDATAGGSATIDVAGRLALGSGSFGDSLSIRAGDATLGTIVVAQNAELNVVGALSFQSFETKKKFLAKAASIDGGTLKSGGDADLTAVGELKLARADIGAALRLKAAQATLGELDVAGDAALNLEQKLSIERITAGGALTLSANVLRASRLAAGKQLALSVRDGEVGTMQSGAATQATASERLWVKASRSGADALFTAPQLQLDQLDATGKGVITVATQAVLGQVNVQQDLAVKAANLQATQLAAGAALDVQAAAAQIDTLKAGGDADLTALGNLKLARADLGAALRLKAAQATLGELDIAGDAKLSLDQSLSIERITAGGALTLSADVLRASRLAAGKQLALSVRDGEVGTMQSGAATQATASERLWVKASRSGADALFTAPQLQLDQLDATGKGVITAATQAVLGQVNVQQDLAVKAANLQATQLAAGAALDVQAAAAQIDTAKAGTAAVLQATDRLTLRAAEVVGRLTVRGGQLTLAGLKVGGELDGEAEAVALAGQVGGALDLKGNRIEAGALAVAGKSHLIAQADLKLDGFVGKQAAVLQGADVQLAKASFDDSLALSATTLTLGSVQAGASTLGVTGTLKGDSLSTGKLQLQADSLQLKQLAVTGDADVKLKASLGIETAKVSGSLTASAADQDYGLLTVGRDVTLRASGSLHASRIEVGGALDAQAARMELGSIGFVKPQDSTVVPGVAVTGAVKLAADSLSLANASIGQPATLVAQKDLVLTGNHSYRASLDARANTLTADTLFVSDLAHLEAKGELAVTQLTAGRIELIGGSLKLGTVNSADALAATAEQALTAEHLMAAKSIRLQAGADLTVKHADAPSFEAQAGKQIKLDLLSADAGVLRSATQIALAQATANSIDLQAPVIQGRVKVATGNTLTARLTGVGGAAAQSVTLDVDTPLRWLVPVLNADTATLSTTGNFAQFDDARVTTTMTLATPGGLIGMSNGEVKAMPGMDVQLYAPNGDFRLIRDGINAYTTALALIYKPGQMVSAPNTGLSPMAAAAGVANGSGRAVGALRPGQLTVNLDALLRRAPTAAGEDDDELVGELEF